jgi:hypothetical protein
LKLKKNIIKTKVTSLLDKTGMGSDLESYQEKEMPASDMRHFKDSKTDKHLSLDCGKMVNGFPYTDEIHGYKLILITDENRAEIYAEFRKKGLFLKNLKLL